MLLHTQVFIICWIALVFISNAFRSCAAFVSVLHGFSQKNQAESKNKKNQNPSLLFEHSQNRRDMFIAANTGVLAVTTNLFALVQVSSASNEGQKLQDPNLNSDNQLKPLFDLPMVRLKLPKQALGREYIVIPLKVQKKGPFYFMVDSGLTTEMITPHLKDMLKIESENSKVRGIGAGGAKENPFVQLRDYSLWEEESESTELKLPTLRAIVTDFPQEHIDPDYDVDGMIGMELLQMFDVDFDFPNRRIKFWAPQKGDKDGLVSIPAAVLNESGLEGIRVISPQQKVKQPMLGIIDSGASFSVVNLAAADLLGLPRDPKKYNSPLVKGVGVDGKPILMPTASVKFSFTGEAVKDANSGAIRFREPPAR
jgi:hypothetical protein